MDKLLKYFNGNELAASVWFDKYRDGYEETPTDMHRRMAKEIARKEKEYEAPERRKKEDCKINLSNYGCNRDFLTEDKVFEFLKNFDYIVPQGSNMVGLGNPALVSLSNCFVVDSPHDSYGGILKADQEIAQLMKRRGGVGLDISTIRPNGTKVNNSAKTATGVVSFMERFSNTTREVGQGSRRGALMISIDVNHPDIMDFIKVKQDLTKVTGANISIRVNDNFMRAVEEDREYVLRFPTDIELWPDREPNILKENPVEVIAPWMFTERNTLKEIEVGERKVIIKIVKAKEVWDAMMEAAHKSAEPGILFWDRVHNYSPDGVYDEFRAISTNP